MKKVPSKSSVKIKAEGIDRDSPSPVVKKGGDLRTKGGK